MNLKVYLFAIAFLSVFSVKAGHLLGGQLNYEYLGSDSFKVTLNLSYDYDNTWYSPTGGGNADTNAVIAVYSGPNKVYMTKFVLSLDSIDTVETTIQSRCGSTSVGRKQLKFSYSGGKYLEPFQADYTLAYFRCCRDTDNYTNIEDDGDGYGAGLALTATIPMGKDNDTPVFDADYPTFMCLDSAMTFDFSATDADADSIAYELVDVTSGGGLYAFAADPDKSSSPYYQPDFETINYSAGYSGTNPFGTGSATIDSLTGQLTLNSSIEGMFVLKVIAKEYRDGVYLGASSNDFSIEVVSCETIENSSGINTDLGFEDGYCGLEVEFPEITQEDIVHIAWNFGDTMSAGDTSSLVAPSYTYPEFGSYNLMLVLGKEDTACYDTITKVINVAEANFDFDIVAAYNDTCNPSILVAGIEPSDVGASYTFEFEGDSTLGGTFFFIDSARHVVDIVAEIIDSNGCKYDETASFTNPYAVRADIIVWPLEDHYLGDTLTIFNQFYQDTPHHNWEVSGQTFNGIGMTVLHSETGTYLATLEVHDDSLRCYDYDTVSYTILSNVPTDVQSLTDQLVIYPSLFDEVLNVDQTGTQTSIQILDLNGRVVLQQMLTEGKNVIGTSNLSKGSYIIYIENGKERFTKQIIKQ